jgi:hypothetical protein
MRLLAALLVLDSARETTGLGNIYETASDPMHSVEVFWDFEDGVQGWGNKTSEEMMCEVTHRGGEMRGVVRELSRPEATDASGRLLDDIVDREATDSFGRPIHGRAKHYSEPHIDSPPLKINAIDRHFIVVRMKYSGLAQSGRVVLRPGEFMPQRAASGPGAVKAKSSNAPEALTESFQRGDYVWAQFERLEWRQATVMKYNKKEETYDVEYHRNQKTDTENGGLCTGDECPREFSVPRVHIRESENRTAYLDDGDEVRTWSSELPDFDNNYRGNDTAPLQNIDFEVIGDGQWREIYIPVWKYYFGNFTQIRLYPALATNGGIQGPVFGDTFSVDWVKIAKAPTVKRVTGCFDKFYSTANLGYGVSNITMTEHVINNHLYHYSTNHFALSEATFIDRDTAKYTSEGGNTLAYASTYHCQREGGQTITLTGTNFGNVHDLRVEVGGRPCEGVRMTKPETQIECTLPPAFPMAVAPSRSSSWRSDGGRVSDSEGRLHDHGAEGRAMPRQYSEREVRGQHAFGEGRLHESYPARERRFYQELPVRVTNGQLAQLHDEVKYLSYSVRPPAPPSVPTISNLCAHSIDLAWQPPVDYWDAITVTGYLVEVRVGGRDGRDHNPADSPHWGWQPWVMFGNITATTIVGLQPDVEYEWRVSSVSEDMVHSDEWRHLDLYGRRAMLPGALVGPPSPPTNLTATLFNDLHFTHFDANQTLNHSSTDKRSTLGPSGVWSGEGHYGLALVGSAQIEGCNASVSCCDKYHRWDRRQDIDDADSEMCLPRSHSCFVQGGSTLVDRIGHRHNGTPTGEPNYEHRAAGEGDANDEGDDDADVRLPTNIRGSAPGAAGQTVIVDRIEGSGNPAHSTLSHRPTEPCGPALRLTPSLARSSAAAWYPRKLNVREGFDTSFVFRLANPSTECTLMDDEYTHCRARGADGFAFVVHNAEGGGTHTLGEAGMGLGYSGILNSLAVEFDTWYNSELLEPYENHIAVHTRGWRHPNSANHSFALGSTPSVPELTDGVHRARIVYDPRASTLEEAVDAHPAAFAPSTHSAYFLSNADYPQGGQADWGNGMGVLSVYIDDMKKPVLILPLNLCATLDCDAGRAWLGFTAATGDRFWQVHDVLEWKLRSTRNDPHYDPPPIVNGEGAHSCNDPKLCVHR